jgi:hypothetical protein
LDKNGKNRHSCLILTSQEIGLVFPI